jgi:hypothetical protein
MPAISSDGKRVLDTGSVVIAGDTVVTIPGFSGPITFQFTSNGGSPNMTAEPKADGLLIELFNFAGNPHGAGFNAPQQIGFLDGKPVWLMAYVIGASPVGSLLNWTFYEG